MSGMKMSGMKMAAPSTSIPNLTTTRDSVTVLLEGKTLPGKGFIHLYDSTPYMILNGHVAHHIPCNTNSQPDVDVLIGPAPNSFRTCMEMTPFRSHRIEIADGQHY